MSTSSTQGYKDAQSMYNQALAKYTGENGYLDNLWLKNRADEALKDTQRAYDEGMRYGDAQTRQTLNYGQEAGKQRSITKEYMA